MFFTLRAAEVNAVGYRRRGQHANFECIQTFARVAVAQLGQMPARVRVHFDVVFSKAALFIGEGAIDQLLQLLDPERFEPENLRARDQRAVDVEERIVSRRTDQPEISSFDVGQEDVLLRFIEMMNLIDEQDRLLAGCAETIRGRGDAPCAFRPRCFRRRSCGRISHESSRR